MKCLSNTTSAAVTPKCVNPLLCKFGWLYASTIWEREISFYHQSEEKWGYRNGAIIVIYDEINLAFMFVYLCECVCLCLRVCFICFSCLFLHDINITRIRLCKSISFKYLCNQLQLINYHIFMSRYRLDFWNHRI